MPVSSSDGFSTRDAFLRQLWSGRAGAALRVFCLLKMWSSSGAQAPISTQVATTPTRLDSTASGFDIESLWDTRNGRVACRHSNPKNICLPLAKPFRRTHRIVPCTEILPQAASWKIAGEVFFSGPSKLPARQEVKEAIERGLLLLARTASCASKIEKGPKAAQ